MPAGKRVRRHSDGRGGYAVSSAKGGDMRRVMRFGSRVECQIVGPASPPRTREAGWRCAARTFAEMRLELDPRG